MFMNLLSCTEKNFKLDKNEVVWFGDEIITDECGKAIYFSKIEI